MLFPVAHTCFHWKPLLYIQPLSHNINSSCFSPSKQMLPSHSSDGISFSTMGQARNSITSLIIYSVSFPYIITGLTLILIFTQSFSTSNHLSFDLPQHPESLFTVIHTSVWVDVKAVLYYLCYVSKCTPMSIPTKSVPIYNCDYIKKWVFADDEAKIKLVGKLLIYYNFILFKRIIWNAHSLESGPKSKTIWR